MQIRLAQPRLSMPAPYLIAQWWAATSETFVLDLGEPSCFACGWYDHAAPIAPDVTARLAWEKSGLQRAHLIPHALGGSSEPSNLAMLCPHCHEHAPDWWHRDAMLTWIRNQPPVWIRLDGDMRREWSAIRPGQAFPDVDPDTVVAALRAGGNTHGHKLSMATVAAAVAAVGDGRLL